MSRSYSILAAALLGVVGLAGLTRLGSGTDVDLATATELASVADVDVAGDGRDDGGFEPVAAVGPDCTLSVRLELGDEHEEVACLELQLIAAGALVDASPDTMFDEATDAAVRSFQSENSLAVDGIIGPKTAILLGTWVGPDLMPPHPDMCPATGRSAVVDRVNQRTWLCEAGDVTDVMPMTSAVSQPDPGVYRVYAKDLNSSSMISGEYSEMTHFVAFTHGKFQGARIAFHSVPTYSNGEFVQPLDSVGSAELHGDSAGCIRVLPDDAELIWSWLDLGDTVTVVS